MRVEVSDQVVAFVRSQSPEPRRRLRLALRKLAAERGDIKALEGPLKGYARLRVGPYRIIFTVCDVAGDGACVRCLFAERRDTVYAVFSRVLQENLLKDG